jgi:hypothetical protein
MLRVRDLSAADLEVFNCNKAVLLLGLGRPDEAKHTLAKTTAVRLGDRIAAYTAVALARMGRSPESQDILKAAEKLSGQTQTLRAAQEHIETGKRFVGSAHVASDESAVIRIQSALFRLSQMDHVQQATVFVEAAEPFDVFITDLVRTATGRLTALAPMMTNIRIDSCEDDLNALLREILSAQVAHLGWSVPDQSKGGWTAKGNPGERDLLVQKNGATLTVLEAVVCDRSVTQEWVRRNLASHFQRVLAYDQCTFFFHLTYAYIEQTDDIMKYLKEMAETEAPAAFKYKGHDEIVKTDSRPPGFIAEYERQRGTVKVAFLILDMGQISQREAAKLSAITKRR